MQCDCHLAQEKLWEITNEYSLAAYLEWLKSSRNQCCWLTGSSSSPLQTIMTRILSTQHPRCSEHLPSSTLWLEPQAFGKPTTNPYVPESFLTCLPHDYKATTLPKYSQLTWLLYHNASSMYLSQKQGYYEEVGVSVQWFSAALESTHCKPL